MEIKLKENERIDDLELKGLKIIQNSEGFCFNIDSVLLSDFAKDIKKGCNIMDLGTGTGILPLLFMGKYDVNKVVGVEIQQEVCNMAKRSVKLNNLEKNIEIINEDIKNLNKIYKKKSFDTIITNPPYKKENSGNVSKNKIELISRHEVKASLEDFIKISKYLLKDNGSFYMVHRAERLVDIFSVMRENKIEPKKIRFVCSNVNKVPKLVLIKGVKNGKSFLKIENNLYVYEKNGEYTEEIMQIYNKK